MIAGWITGRPLGLVGAGLSTSISIAVAVLLMLVYFVRLESYVVFNRQMLRPQTGAWRRILAVGLPPGGEFALIFVYMGVVFWTIRDFGSEAQAGFGVGSRVMQAIFLPALAIAFATGPVAGQNMGAGRYERVRATFRASVMTLGGVMLALTIFCQWRPALLVAGFTDDPEVIAVGADYLRIISWNFLAMGIIFTNSSMFQGMGNTVPAFLASATRLVTFALPAVWLTTYSGFELRHLWYLSVVTTALQAGASWWMLDREFDKRLGGIPALVPAASRA